MIPLRDNIPSSRVPYVNYAIIGVCSFAFVMQLWQAQNAQTIAEQYGMIPARVLHPDQPVEIRELQPVMTPLGMQLLETFRPAAESPINPWWTLLTCMFLHGGWMHFLGNMWFLYIFGDNVEDRFGHFGYLLFYLATGIAAGLLHLATNSDSAVPTIGASGAIAGVMGSYLLLYPHAQVLSLVPIVIFIQILVVPAPLFLGLWFFLQFFQGTLAIGNSQTGGVAWWAHIGGFAAGAAVTWWLRGHAGLLPPPPRLPEEVRPFQHYQYRMRER